MTMHEPNTDRVDAHDDRPDQPTSGPEMDPNAGRKSEQVIEHELPVEPEPPPAISPQDLERILNKIMPMQTPDRTPEHPDKSPGRD